MWSIPHHKGYCSPLSTVRPPHPCGLSCGASLLGRRPPPGLCTGSPVNGCFHGSGSRLPRSPMRPGRARTSGLGVPPLLLARWVGWVAPVRPTHGVLVLSCPSAALRVHVCAVSRATWLLLTGLSAWCVALLVRCPGPLGSCSPVCPLGVLLCVCGVLGHLAPVHWCARSVCCLCVRCPGPLGSCSPVCPLGALFCLCGVLGHLAPVHFCARSACCVACAVSWGTWLLFTGVPARCVGCVCGVLGHLTPVHRCARSACCVACAVSWATWLLFTGVPAWCAVLRVRFPGALGSCSPVRALGVLCRVCGVLGHLAPVNWCARSVRCFACAVSWATWLPFTGVPARCVALRVRCPGPLGSCSPMCPLGVLSLCSVSWATWLLFTSVPARCVALCVPCPRPLGSCSPVCPRGLLCCVCSVLGRLVPVHWPARSVCCFACAVSWATWLLFTGVTAWCAVLRVRFPGALGSCSPVRALGVLCRVCSVLGHLAPVNWCARSVRCFACAVSWATWLPFTGVPARCVALRVRCPGPLGSCSPMCPLGVLSLCSVSWATWLLFTSVPARCVALCVRCPRPLGSCSPVCPRGLLCCVCSVLGRLVPVHWPARSVCCFACAVSWATWLLFTGVPARCVVLLVRCPRPLGSCSPVCPLGVLPACAVFWATWLLFTSVPARCVACVRCPGPLGSCSPVCPLGALFCLCGVLGHLAPVHQCARLVFWVACAVFWATWLLFTGVPAGCVVLRVRCPGPLDSCSPVRSPGVLCGVLGHLAPVHRCARSVCCAVGCVCKASPRGAHSSIRRVAIRSRQGLGTLGARTRPSGRRLFVAGRGWVPSGRTHVHPDGGCSVAGRGWVRCRARTRPSGRRLVLPGTCPPAVVRCGLCALSRFAAPGGRRCLAPVPVPWLWPAACLSGVPRGSAWCAAPRPVRSLSVLR